MSVYANGYYKGIDWCANRVGELEEASESEGERRRFGELRKRLQVESARIRRLNQRTENQRTENQVSSEEGR